MHGLGRTGRRRAIRERAGGGSSGRRRGRVWHERAWRPRAIQHAASQHGAGWPGQAAGSMNGSGGQFLPPREVMIILPGLLLAILLAMLARSVSLGRRAAASRRRVLRQHDNSLSSELTARSRSRRRRPASRPPGKSPGFGERAIASPEEDAQVAGLARDRSGRRWRRGSRAHAVLRARNDRVMRPAEVVGTTSTSVGSLRYARSPPEKSIRKRVAPGAVTSAEPSARARVR